ncbi:MAG TPA: bifunctional riboflavin kinase/FAD synthetase [Desulfosalsimonadaceae bacterium]|nr:bifunctional riboflavin kinase/FAD synthetase [Desulfosalsimonadaceae bacterium]
MELITDLEDIKEPYTNAVVTIGNFDGVHKGHQAILHQVIEKAESIGGVSVAITFEPHPMKVLSSNGAPPLITLFEQKVELIEQTGIDVLICTPFTQSFAAVTARTFIEDILIDKIGMKAIIIGRDYKFGKNREGSVSFLEQYSESNGIEVLVADWIPVSHQIPHRISSTRIREIVMEGRVDEARHLLGRYYQIRGKVVTGRKRGGPMLGFPTANIQLVDELCPKMGVYAVTVQWGEKRYKGVANIGYAPTFDDHLFTAEVHLFDFRDDIYGENIKVNFVQRIRDEKKFAGIEELSEQIRKDIESAGEILSDI